MTRFDRDPRESSEGDSPVSQKRSEVNLRVKEFDNQLLNLAHACGYKAFHIRPALTKWGYRTPIQGDGEGCPDWWLFKAGRPPVVLEAKTGKARMSPEQRDWFKLLESCGVRTREVRPEHLQELANWLMKEN